MKHIVDEYNDPRLAKLYDLLNPLSDDSKFYISLAKEIAVHTIIDLGCGTGLLTSELTAHGFQAIGVEPSQTMLTLAKQNSNSDTTTWIEGDASNLTDAVADLVIMTGHTAQVFLTDESWQSTLTNVYRVLKPGGYLAFESRNPTAKAWEGWNKESSVREINSVEFGKVTVWNEFKSINDELVRFDNHYLFAENDEELIAECEIRFTSQDDLKQSLVASGFTIENVYGDWNEGAVNPHSRELVFVAKRD